MLTSGKICRIVKNKKSSCGQKEAENMNDKYNEKDESRFYRYGKQIVEEQQSKMAQQDKLDEIKKNLAQETNQENNVEDEIEAE